MHDEDGDAHDGGRHEAGPVAELRVVAGPSGGRLLPGLRDLPDKLVVVGGVSAE